jgi:hypothetical protein
LYLITKAQVVSDKNTTTTTTSAPSSSSAAAVVTQFVRITRTYRFTYIDSNKNIPIGFAKNPIENLLSGEIIYCIQYMIFIIIIYLIIY